MLIYSDLAAKSLMNGQQRPLCSGSPQGSSLSSRWLRPGLSCGRRAALPTSCGDPSGAQCRARQVVLRDLTGAGWGGGLEEGYDGARILGCGGQLLIWKEIGR